MNTPRPDVYYMLYRCENCGLTFWSPNLAPDCLNRRQGTRACNNLSPKLLRGWTLGADIDPATMQYREKPKQSPWVWRKLKSLLGVTP